MIDTMPEIIEAAAMPASTLRRCHGILIEGDGIASACVARLLTDAAIPYTHQAQPRNKLPAILLGEQTQRLLGTLFPPGRASTQDLFTGFTRITRRIVLWGNATKPVDLPHRGIVAPEAELLHRLWHRTPSISVLEQPSMPPLRLRSSRAALAPHEVEQTFGTRTGRIAQVELRETSPPEVCWVESVPSGWLFLLSRGEGRATLIAVGDAVAALLSHSRLVSDQIAGLSGETPPLPVSPRLLKTLAAESWIACGTAAMSFDPLCGEGAGHAVREGFLAAAYLRAALAGTDPHHLAEHYTVRLKQGLLRHLEACLPFYATGGSTDFWQSEAASLRSGIASLQSELSHLAPPRFKLVDRDLIAL